MVAACRELAEARGNLDDISLNAVVTAAKTSIGAFYARFKDKEALLAYVLEVALCEAEESTLRDIAGDPVWQAGPADAIVARIVHLYVTHFRTNRGLFRGFLRHYSAHADAENPMRDANRRVGRLVKPWLAGQLKDRPLDTATFEIRAALQFLVSTLANMLLNDPGPLHLDSEELEPHLHRMVARYLGIARASPSSGRSRARPAGE